MVLECRGICHRIGKDRNPLFSEKKRLLYSKGSKCRVCDGIWIKEPTTYTPYHLVCEPELNTSYYNIEGKEQKTISIFECVVVQDVICPCCRSIAMGDPKSESKWRSRQWIRVDKNGNTEKVNFIPYPKPNYKEKSYKEQFGTSRSGYKRFTSDLIHDINSWLRSEDKKLDYERKLNILKQYDDRRFQYSDDYSVNPTPLDRILDILKGAESGPTFNEEISHKDIINCQNKIIKEIDKFARKYKIGLDGRTQEEEKIESTKRLNEAIRRDAEAEARGEKIEYVPVVDIITDENETETNNANGH